MNLSVAVIFVVLGLLINHAKCYGLIAGYNTMSKAEQKKVNIKKIASIFKNGLFGMAALMLLGDALSIYIEDDRIASYTFFLSMAVGIPYILIRSNSKTVSRKNDTL